MASPILHRCFTGWTEQSLIFSPLLKGLGDCPSDHLRVSDRIGEYGSRMVPKAQQACSWCKTSFSLCCGKRRSRTPFHESFFVERLFFSLFSYSFCTIFNCFLL